MERLSNIMKSAQVPHLSAQQRLAQQASNPGQRQAAPEPPLSSGQSRRMGGPERSPGLYRSRSTLPPHSQHSQHAPAERGETWEESMQSPMRPLNRASYENGAQRPQRVPYPRQDHYIEPAPGDYYEEDERSTIVPADIQEEWNDDTAGMRYGDWESAAGYRYPSNYEEAAEYMPPLARSRDTNPGLRPPAQELSPAAQRLAQAHGKHDPLATRELYRVSQENLRGAITRDMRETRLPVPAANPQIAPVQPSPRTPQRTTQPLRSQQHITRLPGEMQQRALRPQQAILPDTPRDTGADFTITVNNAANACPICKGAGFLRNNVPFGHPQFGKAVACQCKEQERKRKRRQQLQEISNLGAFASKRFGTFNSRVPGLQEAFQISSEFAKAPDGWLLLIGPNGCGKTHLAAAIANACLEAGAVVLFATVPDLLDHLRAAFAPDSNEVYDQLFARMREAEMLVLDDLGVQQSSPWANEKLFQLLNYRYNSGFPTVITANPRGLQATDERIRSRLSDISLVATLNLERARDYRPNNPHRG
ncbi:MAG TPA: ATP-binding protein [Ktedonobacteraceae bacterium]